MANLQHRFERIVNRLADEMNRRSDALAEGFQGGSDTPPFSVKLSRQEQLEQYFAMDEAKWQALIQERGLAESLRYSKAMLRLVKTELGTSGQPSEPIMLGPEPMPAEVDQLSGQPLQMVNPATVMTDMAKRVGTEDRAAQDATFTQGQPSSDQLVQETLRNVGL